MLKFTIPGDSYGQPRPRFSAANGKVHTYNTDESIAYKTKVKLIAQTEAKKQRWRFAESEGVGMNVYAYMSIPKSETKKFHAAAVAGDIRPTKKPDVDNIFKAVSDALNGLVFKDDKQIIHARVEKWYDDDPRVEVEVFIVRKELM